MISCDSENIERFVSRACTSRVLFLRSRLPRARPKDLTHSNCEPEESSMKADFRLENLQDRAKTTK